MSGELERYLEGCDDLCRRYKLLSELGSLRMRIVALRAGIERAEDEIGYEKKQHELHRTLEIDNKCYAEQKPGKRS